MKRINRQILLLVSIFFLISNLKAQIGSIELPQGEEEIKINYTTPIISIYVDKENTVYLEKEEIEIGDLGKHLNYIRYKLPIEHQTFIKVFLYIDKETPYKIIDKIKTEIASVFIYNIYYKTGSVEDKDLLKGLGFRNHHSFFKYQVIEKKVTKKQKEENKRYNDSLRKADNNFLQVPPPPPLHWTSEFRYKLYSDQQEIIDEILDGRNYLCISIENNGIKVENELIGFDALERIEEIFLNNDVLLVSFKDDLVYKNYFRMITIVRILERKNKDKHIPLYTEMSTEIREIHKKADVKLCN